MTQRTDFSDQGGLVDVFAVAPAIQAALLLQVRQVDVPARDQAQS